MCATARPFQAQAGLQVETCAMLGANQLMFGSQQELIGGKIERTTLVWAGVQVGADRPGMQEQHKVAGRGFPADNNFFTLFSNINGLAQVLRH